MIFLVKSELIHVVSIFRNGNNIIESLQSYGVLHLGEKYIDDNTINSNSVLDSDIADIQVTSFGYSSGSKNNYFTYNSGVELIEFIELLKSSAIYGSSSKL